MGIRQREMRSNNTCRAALSICNWLFAIGGRPSRLCSGPYGLALLILLFTLYPIGSGRVGILAIAPFVLALDLLAMLCTDLLAKIPFIKPGLDILGCVMGVLLIALAVQAMADGLRLLSEQRF